MSNTSSGRGQAKGPGDKGRESAGKRASSPGEPSEQGRIRELEKALNDTRIELQGVIAQLKESNDRLQASNREVAAMNEELRAANKELAQSEAQLARAQEIAHLGSWDLDLTGNKLTWSDEAYRIFGLQPQQFGATYEAFLQRIHPEDREAVHAAYTESLRMHERGLVLPCYDYCLKCSHVFNLLDARGAISVTERTNYIARVRNLARLTAHAYVAQREAMGYPLLKK